MAEPSQFGTKIFHKQKGSAAWPCKYLDPASKPEVKLAKNESLVLYYGEEQLGKAKPNDILAWDAHYNTLDMDTMKQKALKKCIIIAESDDAVPGTTPLSMKKQAPKTPKKAVKAPKTPAKKAAPKTPAKKTPKTPAKKPAAKTPAKKTAKKPSTTRARKGAEDDAADMSEFSDSSDDDEFDAAAEATAALLVSSVVSGPDETVLSTNVTKHDMPEDSESESDDDSAAEREYELARQKKMKSQAEGGNDDVSYDGSGSDSDREVVPKSRRRASQDDPEYSEKKAAKPKTPKKPRAPRTPVKPRAPAAPKTPRTTKTQSNKLKVELEMKRSKDKSKVTKCTVSLLEALRSQSESKMLACMQILEDATWSKNTIRETKIGKILQPLIRSESIAAVVKQQAKKVFRHLKEEVAAEDKELEELESKIGQMQRAAEIHQDRNLKRERSQDDEKKTPKKKRVVESDDESEEGKKEEEEEKVVEEKKEEEEEKVVEEKKEEKKEEEEEKVVEEKKEEEEEEKVVEEKKEEEEEEKVFEEKKEEEEKVEEKEEEEKEKEKKETAFATVGDAVEALAKASGENNNDEIRRTIDAILEAQDEISKTSPYFKLLISTVNPLRKTVAAELKELVRSLFVVCKKVAKS